jgi:hypothetical protein
MLPCFIYDLCSVYFTDKCLNGFLMAIRSVVKGCMLNPLLSNTDSCVNCELDKVEATDHRQNLSEFELH